MAYKSLKQHEKAAKFARKRHVHYLGVVGVAGSNPVTPTIKAVLRIFREGPLLFSGGAEEAESLSSPTLVFWFFGLS